MGRSQKGGCNPRRGMSPRGLAGFIFRNYGPVWRRRFPSPFSLPIRRRGVCVRTWRCIVLWWHNCLAANSYARIRAITSARLRSSIPKSGERSFELSSLDSLGSKQGNVIFDWRVRIENDFLSNDAIWIIGSQTCTIIESVLRKTMCFLGCYIPFVLFNIACAINDRI